MSADVSFPSLITLEDYDEQAIYFIPMKACYLSLSSFGFTALALGKVVVEDLGYGVNLA